MSSSELWSKHSKVPIQGAKLADWLRDRVAFSISKHLAGKLVSVTKVTLSPDSRIASIWVRCFPVSESQTLFSSILKLKRIINKDVNQDLHRKIVPNLTFILDTSVEDEANIDSLLNL